MYSENQNLKCRIKYSEIKGKLKKYFWNKQNINEIENVLFWK
jgi:hypothetical protein